MDSSALPPTVSGTMLTVGTFDGVHRGHRDVIGRLVREARAAGLASVLVTFEPHPLAVVRPEAAPPLLTLPSERLEALAPIGLDYLAVLPFTRTLAAYTAEQFVDLVLRPNYRLRHLVMGYDHGFGRGREGSPELLRALGASRGFEVEVVGPVLAAAGAVEGMPDDAGGAPAVSSSRIRRAVAAGDLAAAARGLGRAYSVSGRVVHGAGRGRSLGFRTLNLAPPDPRKLLPPEGVYAVRVQTPGGAHDGMVNLGPRPTFGEDEVGLEAHLFDAEGDWYGAWVRVDFVSRLRDTMRFPDAGALRRQLAEDERAARRALTLAPDAGNLYSSPFCDDL